MPLLNFRNIHLSYGPNETLLENAQLCIEPKERICLIGRNGAGKSSLLKMIQGTLAPDAGDIERAPHLKIATLIQEIPDNLSGTIFEVVGRGLEDLEPWERTQKVETILSKMGLDPDALVENLSGGYIRRVLMACAIVSEPDILLLDEPTNHLDIDTIAWLEDFLAKYHKTILFITHDRVLLQKLATRIIEIDRGQLLSWKGSYQDYLVHRAAQLEAESRKNDLFDKRLAEEEVWIRQGVKARRTRNEGRVRQLEQMRRERGQRREQVGTAQLQTQAFQASGQLVFELKNISHSYGGKTIIRDFSSTVMRGDKIGIVGPNGCGKSTILQIILEQLQPTSGSMRQGTQLDISYFDQKREQLDDNKPVIDNIADGCDFVTINGKSVHLMRYLNDFLFSSQRARMLTKGLSGGERHRLLLARLFTRPSNVLILDEPTNDLDAETLELLEEKLASYEGTLILVSHDRAFLNNIVTSTWIFEGDGDVAEYVGGYDDYLRQRGDKQKSKEAEKGNKSASNPVLKKSTGRLSHKEKLELAALPGNIEKLEAERDALYQKIADPRFLKENKQDMPAVQIQINNLETAIALAYARWEALDAL